MLPNVELRMPFLISLGRHRKAIHCLMVRAHRLLMPRWKHARGNALQDVREQNPEIKFVFDYTSFESGA